ncbi:class I SAM-dependent methyltransferase [Sorangium sp. So ce1014]|uniref:class I SAM-dependent methyltransferase n=1 Tax=Sorangium sp. So ce1014 TaxID=3133326 RepID=UPI003F615857
MWPAGRRISERGRCNRRAAGASSSARHPSRRRAMAWELPYPDGTFDRVASSLMFHHLAADDKRRTAEEILRVLRPGGALLLADFGSPRSAPGRAVVGAPGGRGGALLGLSAAGTVGDA